MRNQSKPYMSHDQQPSQSERNQRLIPRLRHLADMVNVKLVRADRLARANKLAQADRLKNVEKEDTHDQQTKSPLSQ